MEEPMTPDPSKIRILLVEDAATMRKIELKTLKELGFGNIAEATDGVDAMARIEAGGVFDLVISDWNMPNKSGYDLLLWVRSNEATRDIPFIMATGQGDMKQEKKAVDAGVSSFVAKPFNKDELASKIEEAFGILQETEAVPTVQERESARASTGKITLRVAHIQITDHLILGVLKHLLEKGDLKAETFELETRCMAGWNPVRDALRNGTVDAACILAPIAMDLFAFGAPVRLVLLAHKNGSIFVRNRVGRYHEPYEEYFRGKSFYIPHQMSIHHMLAHLFFQRIGLTSGMSGEGNPAVHFEVVAPIKMPEFLKANPDACGFMVAEPLGTKSIAAGIAESQLLSSELWDNHPCCVVAMRDDFMEPYSDAVYEFTRLLVEAGRFIERKPETAAEIAVRFLDPDGKLGLKVPLLKNVLTEDRGIRTSDLYPEIEDFEYMQHYMVNEMGIGSPINLSEFIVTRFADAACTDRDRYRLPSRVRDDHHGIREILERSDHEGNTAKKNMLNLEGKYLTFHLDDQEFGIDILKVKEIIGMIPIRSMPQSPPFIRGVVNLRGRVIPVMDLRARFDIEEREYSDRTCIIILDVRNGTGPGRIGVIVDSVSEVVEMKASEIEDTPHLGDSSRTDYILGMAKQEDRVKILLDMDCIANHIDTPEIPMVS
jgi:chemotaxis signal transduction protein/ABC-type nitrate/sulfonate/bicarbonate transport system substrate-binding protein